MYHCIMKWNRYKKINYELKYIFTLKQPYHNVAIMKKGYERLDLMIVYS
jgi:hypothetical protein